MAYTFPAMVAWDSIGKQAVKSTSFQVYAMADTGFVTPLAITDPFGTPLPGNILNSGTQAVFPEFRQADNPTIRITDAARNYVWTVTSVVADDSVAGFVGNKASAAAGAVRAATASIWQSSTAYVVGQPVINPTGDLMRCTTAHTSTTAYDSTKFTLSATDASGATSAALSATYGPDAQAASAPLKAAFAAKAKLPTGATFGTTQTVINRTNGTAVCIGVDQQNANGSMWFADVTNGVLVQSDDGNVTQSNKGWPSGGIFAPTLSAPTTATTGGTLPAGPLFYKATYTNASGETVGSNEVTVTTTGTTSTASFTIGAAPTGATGTKIYRSTTAGTEVLLDTLVTTPTTYTDTGAKAPGTATVPAANTTGSNVSSSAGARIVKFASTVLLLAVDNIDGKVKVWTAPYVNQATAFVWSAPVLTLTAGATVFPASMEVSKWGANERVIVTEYGDPTGGPSAWISTDGATFTKRYGADATMRHIHHAAFDPYNQGHIWMTCGDGIAKTVVRSTDFGLTWTTAVVSSEFQAVQISFSPDWVFLAGDSRRGTVMVVDRATNTPRWASRNYHHDIPPARLAVGSRKVTTLGFTAGSNTVTSTGEFNAGDQRRYLTAGNGILPADTYVVTVTPPNTITLNRNALATIAAQAGVIYGDMYLSNAYYGAVDPASGVYYCVANDTSNSGTMQGMFYLDQPGGQVSVIDPGGDNISMNGFVFCYRGRVWSGMWSRPLLSVL